MNQSLDLEPTEFAHEGPHDHGLQSIDSRPLTPTIQQEIVLLANAVWLIWLDARGDVIAAQKGALA